MTDLQTKITGILQSRRNQLPLIEKQISRYSRLKQNVLALKSAINVILSTKDSGAAPLKKLGGGERLLPLI